MKSFAWNYFLSRTNDFQHLTFHETITYHVHASMFVQIKQTGYNLSISEL